MGYLLIRLNLIKVFYPTITLTTHTMEVNPTMAFKMATSNKHRLQLLASTMSSAMLQGLHRGGPHSLLLHPFMSIIL